MINDAELILRIVSYLMMLASILILFRANMKLLNHSKILECRILELEKELRDMEGSSNE